ncbi:CHASE domain-containing protein [Colwelliaceae bacterium 6471]
MILNLKLVVANVYLVFWYIVLAYLSLLIAPFVSNISILWFPAGLALVYAYIYGVSIFFGVVIGSILFNYFFTDFGILISLIIGIGAGLQALLGRYLLHRCASFNVYLLNAISILRLIFVGAFVTSLLNASVSNFAMVVLGYTSLQELPTTFVFWWLGDSLGIIVAAPLVIAFIYRKKSEWKDRVNIIFGAFFTIFSLSVIVAFVSQQYERNQVLTSMEEITTIIGSRVDQRVHSHIDALHSLSALMEYKNPLANEEFVPYINHLLHINKGFRAISWNPLVLGENLSRFEQQERERLGDNYRLTEMIDGVIGRINQRDKHVIVQYIVPETDNKKVIGFDVYSNPVRRAALDYAIANKTISTSDSISLVQSQKSSPSTLLFLPILKEDKVVGFLTGVLELDLFLREAIDELDSLNFSIKLLSDNSQVLYQISNEIMENESEDRIFSRKVFFDIGNKRFSLVVEPNTAWINKHKAGFSISYILFCILITILIIYQALIITGKHYLIESLSLDQKKKNKKLFNINKELEEALLTLKDAQDRLITQEKLSSLGNLVSGLAHEINTPAGISLTATSYLQEVTEDILKGMNDASIKKSELMKYFANVSETSGLVISNINRISLLVERFKMLSADINSESRTRFSIKEQLTNIVSSMKGEIDKGRHKVSITCPDIEIESFFNVFTYLFTYLIDNSLEHGFHDINSGNISVDVQIATDKLVINYADNGHGMNEETLALIFEPFFTTKRKDGSVGLGGTIFFNIVSQIFNGTINCQSEIGKGFTISVTIPIPSESIRF